MMMRRNARELAGTDALKRDKRAKVGAFIAAFAPRGSEKQVAELVGNLEAKHKEEQMAELKKLCGLWKKSSKSGRTYYSGKVERDITIPAGSYVNVFKVEEATEENRKPNLEITFSEAP